MFKSDCVGSNNNNTHNLLSRTCLNAIECNTSSSSSPRSTISDTHAPVDAGGTSLKRKCVAFLPLLFSSRETASDINPNSLGLITLKELEIFRKKMTSRGIDRNVRQTIPSTRRKARASPRSSSVSTSEYQDESRMEPMDLYEAEREYQRQSQLEKSASDLAMEAMEYKFLSRRKRLMAKKMARESRDKSEPRISESIGGAGAGGLQGRFDANGNLVVRGRSGPESVEPDLSLSITTKMDFSEPQGVLEKPLAGRVSAPNENIRAKHDKETKRFSEPESERKRSRFAASLVRTTSDSECDPEREEDSGYDAKSATTDTQMDPSRAVSRGSFSSSARPQSSEFEESAWGSQELLESDSSVRKKSVKSRSSDDLETDQAVFQDADECDDDNMMKYRDFDVGEPETPAEYEIIDLHPQRIDVKDKSENKGNNNYTKELPAPATQLKSQQQRRTRIEGRRSTSDPIRDRIPSSLFYLPSVVRRGSTAMPYHFAMPSSSTSSGYMRPTVASLRARYEHENDGINLLQSSPRDRERSKISESIRAKRSDDELLLSKKLDDERNKRYEEWLKKVDHIDIIPQQSRDRIKKPESELYHARKSDDSDGHMARAYRRRVVPEDELIFPISRKTQTKPDLLYEVKMVSRGCQTDDKSRNDVAVNTEIDYRLMSALLEKLLTAKTSVGVQTDWKNDVVQTRDVGVSTEKIFRERFSPLPATKSKFAQTDASALRSKNKSVSTDPDFTGHRHRIRTLREPFLSRFISAGVQTDPPKVDACVEANFSSFSSESEESVVSSYPKGSGVSSYPKGSGVSSYPKGFHPKTGKLLDEKLFSDYYRAVEQNKSAMKKRDPMSPPALHKMPKTPEPIIEELASSTSSSGTESDASHDMDKKTREVYRSSKIPELYSDRKTESETYENRGAAKLSPQLRKAKSEYELQKKKTKDKSLLETNLEYFDREPIGRDSIKPKFTSEKSIESQRESKSPVSQQETYSPLPSSKTIETQTNQVSIQQHPAASTSIPLRIITKDVKTESKIIVEVTQSRNKERSEVTSFTQLNEDGRISRTTRVTTSKHEPVPQRRNLFSEYSSDQVTEPSTPRRPLSPIRKAQSEINVTPFSDVSTRPASAADLLSPTPNPSIPSTFSASTGLDLKSPSPHLDTKSLSPDLGYSANEINVPKVGRVNIQDPMHLVVIAPPDSFVTKDYSYSPGQRLLIPVSGGTQWRETSSSTICNEMTTDAFKDDEGVVQQPKSVTMTTETVIDNTGKESKVHTRSRTSRKYAPDAEENAITTDTTLSGPIIEDLNTRQSVPSSINKTHLLNVTPNKYLDLKPQLSSPPPSSPPQKSYSPLVQLVDTPEIPDFKSPEPVPEPIHKKHKTSMKKQPKEKQVSSLEPDAPASSFLPDEDDVINNKIIDAPPTAPFVEPLQQMKTAIVGDGIKSVAQTNSAPGTEIITRIIRTSRPDEKKKSRRAKTVLEQELNSGDPKTNSGCKISSSITFDTPHNNNRGVIIRELNDDGTSKDGSMDGLDQKPGEILTESNFQRFKSPVRGANGREETSWKYSMECNCVSGSNTTVRTIVNYRRQSYPATTYETSL